MLDMIIEFLKGRFGERRVMRWGLVGTIILLVGVVYVFFTQELSNSFDKYYEYKLDRCKDASQTTAQIASSDDDTTLKKAIARFDELYYGELVIFEGRGLEKAMVNFRKQLVGENSDTDISYEQLQKIRKDDPKKLRQLALQVSASCYQEITPSFLNAMIDRLNPRPRPKY